MSGINPPSPDTVINCVMALVAGNLVGSSANRVVELMDERLDLTSKIGLSAPTKSILDHILHLFLEISLVNMGGEFVVNAMPFLAEGTGPFSMWILGLLMNSESLKHHLMELNKIFFLPLSSSSSLNASSSLASASSSSPSSSGGVSQ